MVDGGGVPFSVVYFDGETEATVGEVIINSSFNFNKFLSFLSQKIGISPHQFSVYLATFGTSRKIPITAKVNFAAIARENPDASFFFVKRCRRPKRNKARSNKGSRDNANNNNISIKNPPANVVLLRRNANVPFSGLGTMAPVLSRVDYEKRVRDLQAERDRYLMSMAIGDLCLGREPSNGGVVCEGCSMGSDGGFHWCVFDAVTVGFRSPAGPVARPVKGSG